IGLLPRRSKAMTESRFQRSRSAQPAVAPFLQRCLEILIPHQRECELQNTIDIAARVFLGVRPAVQFLELGRSPILIDLSQLGTLLCAQRSVPVLLPFQRQVIVLDRPLVRPSPPLCATHGVTRRVRRVGRGSASASTRPSSAAAAVAATFSAAARTS